MHQTQRCQILKHLQYRYQRSMCFMWNSTDQRRPIHSARLCGSKYYMSICLNLHLAAEHNNEQLGFIIWLLYQLYFRDIGCLKLFMSIIKVRINLCKTHTVRVGQICYVGIFWRSQIKDVQTFKDYFLVPDNYLKMHNIILLQSNHIN